MSGNGQKGKGKSKLPTARRSPHQQKKRKAKSKSESAPRTPRKKKTKNKKKKKGKSKKSDNEHVPGKRPKRKVVRGIVEKYCVCCLCHSTEDDPLLPEDQLKWMRPRFEDQGGVEGSQCFYCRRLHRAKAPLP